MPRLIVAPLDTSRFAEQALPHAIALARRAHAQLQLVCVRPSLMLDRSGDEEERYLAGIAAQLEPELPTAIGYEVLMDELAPYYTPLDAGRVAEVLSRYVREHDAEMIVMATHGRSGVRRAWLGSVAHSLIRTAPRPVLLTRPQDEAFGSAIAADRGIRHIVIPLDGSPIAEQVLPYALSLGSGFGARYSLVRVIAPTQWDVYEPWSARVAAFGITTPGFAVSNGTAEQNRLDVAESLERVAARLRAHGVAVAARVLEAFSPSEAIVHYAEAQGADAIALSTTGGGLVHRLVLGSVSDSIVRTSQVPVLICNIRRFAPTAAATLEAASASV